MVYVKLALIFGFSGSVMCGIGLIFGFLFAENDIIICNHGANSYTSTQCRKCVK